MWSNIFISINCKRGEEGVIVREPKVTMEEKLAVNVGHELRSAGNF